MMKKLLIIIFLFGLVNGLWGNGMGTIFILKTNDNFFNQYYFIQSKNTNEGLLLLQILDKYIDKNIDDPNNYLFKIVYNNFYKWGHRYKNDYLYMIISPLEKEISLSGAGYEDNRFRVRKEKSKYWKDTHIFIRWWKALKKVKYKKLDILDENNNTITNTSLISPKLLSIKYHKNKLKNEIKKKNLK